MLIEKLKMLEHFNGLNLIFTRKKVWKEKLKENSILLPLKNYVN